MRKGRSYLSKEPSPEGQVKLKPKIGILRSNIGTKVLDIDLIGMDQFRWGITTNIASFQYDDSPRAYQFILLGLEMIPKGLDKAEPKYRVNITPLAALRFCANIMQAIREVKKWSMAEAIHELSMEMGV